MRPVVQGGSDPKVRLVQQGGQFSLHLTLGPGLKLADTALVTTALLRRAKIPGLAYENADGASLEVDTDYFGKKRSKAHPTPGPLENPVAGPIAVKVW